jgi:short subunit dehydrogenase-like uncharacterized protein
MTDEREFDIVRSGASGFVGHLTAARRRGGTLDLGRHGGSPSTQYAIAVIECIATYLSNKVARR